MILRLSTLHRAVLTTAVVCLTLSTSSWAKTPSEVRAACRAEGRPCVGLVLSGGGARGFAHVGVIKVLEELGVKIDVIAGTSMGSMVGGAYAAGFTSKALEDTVLEVDWSKMLAPRPQRDILSWRRKLDDYKSLPSAGIEISNDGTPRFPDAFVPSEELKNGVFSDGGRSFHAADPLCGACNQSCHRQACRHAKGLHTESSDACVNVGAGSLFTSQTGR